MERKSLPNLLEPKREYTYEEAFRIYYEAGQAACAEENRLIAQKNAKMMEEVAGRNRERENNARAKNNQNEKEAEALNSKENKSRLVKVATISLIAALVAGIATEEGGMFLIGLPVAFVILMFFIKPKEHWADHEDAEEEKFSEIPSKNYTFLPSGTIQCSSCGTKTKIDTKDAGSTCPNCRSEIFVISNMEDNVTVKTMASK